MAEVFHVLNDREADEYTHGRLQIAVAGGSDFRDGFGDTQNQSDRESAKLTDTTVPLSVALPDCKGAPTTCCENGRSKNAAPSQLQRPRSPISTPVGADVDALSQVI